jgi:hypothetical protein
MRVRENRLGVLVQQLGRMNQKKVSDGMKEGMMM